jgi:DNA repair exonuclease SbcCD ATPase subunit
MKLFSLGASLLFSAAVASEVKDDRAVTKVVKLLEGMMVKSKEDGDKDRNLYAKFKCYCDTQEAKKTAEIEGLTTNIARLESSIEKLKGATGELSTECSQLRADMQENEQARESAQSIRDKEHENFVAEEEDLVAAIDQMKLAIDTLAEVGADQTMEGAAADHKMAMAGFEGSFLEKKGAALAKFGAHVKEALTAASAFLPSKEKKVVASFVQAPFTGTYSAVSGEVVGILKNMRDTFTENLATARSTEEAQFKANEKFQEIKTVAYDKMSGLYDEKQAKLGENDDQLASDQKLLAEDKEQKAIKEDFLAELIPLCAERKKEYEERVALRANEDAAIAEALAILNSDAAFAAMGKTDATSTGATGFLQLASVHSHKPDAIREKAQLLLKKAGSAIGSLRLAQIAVSLEAENPFEVVLKEIKKMIKLTEEEGKVDKEKLDWCRDEREKNEAELEEKKSQISELESKINELTNTIHEPEVGLIDSIKKDEESLVECGESQTTATTQRQGENAAYQTDISNLVEAEDLLSRAVKVLEKYYSDIEDEVKDEHEAVTLSGESEAAPDAGLEKGYSGQAGAGKKVIDMITFIADETKKEEKVAHEDEQAAQSDYEELLTGLKEEEVKLKESIANLKETLSEKEKELMDAENLLKKTEEEKAAIEAYLLSIKPGCDFMEDNFDLRETRRASETSALEEASTLLKDSPAYKSWESADHLESLGACKDKCVEAGEENVVCKACLAKVEVPGYCAGHPDTQGC